MLDSRILSLASSPERNVRPLFFYSKTCVDLTMMIKVVYAEAVAGRCFPVNFARFLGLLYRTPLVAASVFDWLVYDRLWFSRLS